MLTQILVFSFNALVTITILSLSVAAIIHLVAMKFAAFTKSSAYALGIFLAASAISAIATHQYLIAAEASTMLLAFALAARAILRALKSEDSPLAL